MCSSSEPHQNPKASGFRVQSLVNFSWDQKVKTVAFSLLFKFPSWSCPCSSEPTFCTSTSALPRCSDGSFLPADTELSRACRFIQPVWTKVLGQPKNDHIGQISGSNILSSSLCYSHQKHKPLRWFLWQVVKTVFLQSDAEKRRAAWK